MADIRNTIANMGLTKPDAYTPYAAGAKMYATPGGTPNGATQQPGAAAGYNAREMRARAKRNAMLRYMQAGQQGQYASTDYQQGQAQGWHNSGGI